MVDAVWCGEGPPEGICRICVAGSILKMVVRCGAGAGDVRVSVGA